MPLIEIYTTRYCPYCHAAKALLKRKGVDFTEIDLGRDWERRNEMIERANGGMTVPQIFIGATHVGGCDELHALDARRQARLPCSPGEGTSHEHVRLQGRDDPDALRARARRQYRRRRAHDRRGEVGRRRLRADAGNDQHHGGQARAAVRHHRGGRRRHLARHLPRAGAQARHLCPCRFAGDQAFARQGRQPLVPDRSEGRHRRALRQDPHVRRRSRRRRELSRIAQLPAGRTGGAVAICRGAGSD